MGKKKVPSRTVGDTPTPPITKRSLNPAIIDDNIAKLEKAIKAGDVTPNPSGTSEETLLTTIGIDGKKYDIGASAENVSYDNADSGLTADDAQGAIDEVNTTLVNLKEDLEDILIFKDDFTIASGFTSYQNERLTTSSTAIVTIGRSNGLWSGYQVFPIVVNDGTLTIYVRDNSGNLPADNTSINLNILIKF